MKYAIEYEHLKEELVTNESSQWCFDEVKDLANKHKLELSDYEFEGFIKLRKAGADVNWLMHKMGTYNNSFSDALISYIST